MNIQLQCKISMTYELTVVRLLVARKKVMDSFYFWVKPFPARAQIRQKSTQKSAAKSDYKNCNYRSADFSVLLSWFNSEDFEKIKFQTLY